MSNIAVDAKPGVVVSLDPQRSAPRRPRPYPGAIIARGQMDSDAVRAIQARLNQAMNSNLVVDGDFGEATENAVRLFQARHLDAQGEELEVDGQVGRKTWGSLFGDTAGDEAVVDREVDLRSLVVSVAASQIGVMEEPRGSNRGPEVDEYIRASGLNPGNGSFPWCICFIQWVFLEAAKVLGDESPLPRTAGVHALWQMRNRGTARILTPPEAQPAAIKPGMVFLFDTGGGKGHAGIVQKVQGDRIVTIEGNTNNGGSRDGYGVFRRSTRKVRMSGLLGYLDFC